MDFICTQAEFDQAINTKMIPQLKRMGCTDPEIEQCVAVADYLYFDASGKYSIGIAMAEVYKDLEELKALANRNI